MQKHKINSHHMKQGFQYKNIALSTISFKVFVPYMDSALNMDTPNIFKGNKFYRHITLHVHEEKQLKR